MNKLFSMIGLATKAGVTVSGEFSVEKAIKDRKAYVVIVSEEASENTKKKFTDKCTFYKVPVFITGSSAEMGDATGNESRMSLAVLDKGFGEKIIEMLED